MELTVAWTPAPAKPIAADEFAALLMRVTLPDTLPVPAGARVTFRLTLCPGLKMVPDGTPLALKPGPEIVTLEIEIGEFPELVKVTGRELLVPTVVLPKFKLGGLAVNCADVSGLTGEATADPALTPTERTVTAVVLPA